MKTPWLNHGLFETEAEALAMAENLIGGGIVQLQDDGWHCFGAREFAEKIAAGEL